MGKVRKTHKNLSQHVIRINSRMGKVRAFKMKKIFKRRNGMYQFPYGKGKYSINSKGPKSNNSG